MESKGVWYNTDMSLCGQDKCLSHTLDWIVEMVKGGDIALEDGDARLEGCDHIRCEASPYLGNKRQDNRRQSPEQYFD